MQLDHLLDVLVREICVLSIRNKQNYIKNNIDNSFYTNTSFYFKSFILWWINGWKNVEIFIKMIKKYEK